MSDAAKAFEHYVAAQHVEGKAAIQIRTAGSTGGTIHHNNPYGTCLYCRLQVPTLLPPGTTLTVVPLPTAVARSPWWASETVTFVATSGEPSRRTTEHDAGPSAHGAEIFSLAGSRHVTTVEALTSVLRERRGDADHFEISPSPPRFPVLTLMVHGDYAVLHHFSSPDDAGAQSRGNLHAVPPVVEFPDPGGEVVTLSGSAVVDVVTAERCVVEFMSSWDRPAGVEWRVL